MLRIKIINYPKVRMHRVMVVGGDILSRQSIYERLSDVTRANVGWPKGVDNASIAEAKSAA